MFFLGLSLANAADLVVAPVSAANLEALPFTLHIEQEMLSRLALAKIDTVEPFQVLRDNPEAYFCDGIECARKLLYYPQSTLMLQSIVSCSEDDCFLELAVYNSKEENPIYRSGHTGSYSGMKAQIQGAIAFIDTELQKSLRDQMNEGFELQEEEQVFEPLVFEHVSLKDKTVQWILELPDLLKTNISELKRQQDLKREINRKSRQS